MCLILFAYDYHPRYKLVVAANRDEFYERPTLPVGYWEDNPNILAGKDLREGGTWMGITTAGRFAALTNYRDPTRNNPEAPSRGHLVLNYLKKDIEPEVYLSSIADGGKDYKGFNLLVGNYDSMYYFSNYDKAMRKLEKGIYGLSNSLLDVPWPKVTKGSKTLTEILQNEDIEVESLFTMMADCEQPEDQDLPDTGVGIELERMLGPAFVMSDNYGTSLSTVILVGHDRKINLWERTYISKSPEKWNEVYHEFQSE